MALNSVKFRIEGDGTSALKALSDVKRGMQDVKSVMASEISSKIKQVFSVAAIEEMTRRTAQWANELTNTARKLQVSTNELQGFQIAARKLGMDESKIEGWFNTMEDAAYDALKGNTALLVSFQKLKIGMDDLRNMRPGDLFTKILGNMGTEKGIQGAQELFGRSETQDLRSVAGLMGGKSGAQMAEENQSQVVPESDLAEIKASWGALMQSLVKVRAVFAQFLSFILQIVTGLVEMASGTAAMVARGWKLIAYSIGSMLGSKSSKKKLEELSKESEGAASAIGAGIRNSLRGMVNFGASIVGADTESVAKGIGKMETKPEGMSQKLWDEAQGTGGAITAIGLGGTRGLTGKGPSGLSGVGAGVIRGVSNASAQAAMRLLMRGAFRIGSIEDVAALWETAGLGPFKAPKNVLEAQAMLQKIENAFTTAKGMGPELTSKMTQAMATAGSVLTAHATAGGMGLTAAQQALVEQRRGEVPFYKRNPMLNFNGFGQGGGGSGNLSIGGVFGADVSFKIIQLNTDMLATMQAMLAIMQENRNPQTYVAPTGLH